VRARCPARSRAGRRSPSSAAPWVAKSSASILLRADSHRPPGGGSRAAGPPRCRSRPWPRSRGQAGRIAWIRRRPVTCLVTRLQRRSRRQTPTQNAGKALLPGERSVSGSWRYARDERPQVLGRVSPGSAACADRRSHVARANRYIRVRREIHDHCQPARRPGRLLPGRGPRPQPDRLRRDAARRPRRFRAAARPRGRDRGAAEPAVELGVNHIDTADAYGPYITNEIIREALFPYGDHVHIVTKVGLVRDERGGFLPANSPQSLRKAGARQPPPARARRARRGQPPDPRRIDDRATVPDTLTPQFEALAELQQQGLIRHIGLSTVSLDQLAEAQQIAPVVCVQKLLQHRQQGGRGGARGNGRAAQSRTCRTSRSAASRRYSPTYWSGSPSGSARPRQRSPSPGCYSTRRT